MTSSRAVVAWLFSIVLLHPLAEALSPYIPLFTPHKLYLALLMLMTLLAIYAQRRQQKGLRDEFWWVFLGLTVAFLLSWY